MMQGSPQLETPSMEMPPEPRVLTLDDANVGEKGGEIVSDAEGNVSTVAPEGQLDMSSMEGGETQAVNADVRLRESFKNLPKGVGNAASGEEAQEIIGDQIDEAGGTSEEVAAKKTRVQEIFNQLEEMGLTWEALQKVVDGGSMTTFIRNFLIFGGEGKAGAGSNLLENISQNRGDAELLVAINRNPAKGLAELIEYALGSDGSSDGTGHLDLESAQQDPSLMLEAIKEFNKQAQFDTKWADMQKGLNLFLDKTGKTNYVFKREGGIMEKLGQLKTSELEEFMGLKKEESDESESQPEPVEPADVAV